jgi:FtsZ-binding cell division protein ZapB
MSEENQVVDALVESNDLLQEEVTRLRETNAMLRRVNHALRRTLDSLRNQVAAATENDDTFRRYCEGEFDAQVTESEGTGLVDSESQVEEAV